MIPAPVELRLRLPHIELAALAYGPEHGRPVLGLHGWLDNAASFARLAPRLEGMRLVVLDMAGHGLSGHRSADADYTLASYALDALLAAEQLGWTRFSLIGHSLGAIVAVQLAASQPQRIERLALIDGLVPPVTEEHQAPRQLGDALQARLRASGGRKRVYPDREQALQARQAVADISRSATELLLQRGLQDVPGGFVWRSDPRLRLPSAQRLSHAQAWSFVGALQCPAQLVLAERGLLASRNLQPWLSEAPLQVQSLPGGHHLHLDDEAGASSVADCFNRFLAEP